MTTPYNNQWILGRPRLHRRERTAVSGALRPASDQPPQERPERNERRDRRGSHDSGAARENRHRVHLPRGFDPAFNGGVTRKPPRWIDRDI
jgi:hypothetical protein